MASILEALQPHPEDRLHLRLHRARSVILTSQDVSLSLRNRLVEIRAAQRTFEGAYMRTALSQFSFALVVLKIFTSEFYPIGALLACYGAAVLLVAIYRRYEGNRQFFDAEEESETAFSSSSSASEREREREGRRRSLYERTRGRGSSRGRQMVVKKKFRTSGNSVGLLVGLSLVSYASGFLILSGF
ncbi:uncharacterized protein B0T15DRAFT_547240 [Chaetomium strumarium]|uniref:DUF202 domain-containing protein n=1 Tax=Chaetomium strumarium TaxID=1170767 RepID=A0AAJ0H2E6_9PEZI|nr:hypothetical protein B0T15DRAFT_547240 [Chaetomium strumarium]